MNNPDPQNEIILSICLIGRNDDYGRDFKRRLRQSMDFLAYSAEKAGVLDKIEVLLTDWNSDTPLAEAVTFSPAAAKMIKFIEVPPAVAKKHNYGNTPFHTTKGVNVGLRRASGRYVGMMPGDILISEFTLERLIKLLTGKLNVSFDPAASLLGVPRKFIPHYGEEQRFFKDNSDIGRILVLNDFYLRDDIWPKGLMGGYGFLIMSRELCFKVKGFDENLGGWGPSDVKLALRLSCSNPLVNLSGFGILCYDFEPDKKMVGEKKTRLNESRPVSSVEGDTDWGLGSETFKITPAVTGGVPPDAAGNLISRNQLLDNNFRYKLLLESRKIPFFHMGNISSDAIVAANITSQLYPSQYLDIGSNDVSHGLAVSMFSPLSELFFVSDYGDSNFYFCKIGSALCDSKHVGAVRYFPFSIEDVISAKFGITDTNNIRFDLITVTFAGLGCDFSQVLDRLFQFVSARCAWVFNYSGHDQQLPDLTNCMKNAFPGKKIMHSPEHCLIIWADFNSEALPGEENKFIAAWKPFTGNIFSNLLSRLDYNKEKFLKILPVLLRQKIMSWPRTIRMIIKK